MFSRSKIDDSMSVIDNASVMLQLVASVKIVIYDRNFIVQAKEQCIFTWYKNNLIEGSSEKVNSRIILKQK